MTKKGETKSYVSPAVLRRISVEMESPILAGSTVDSTSIKTVGQEKDGFYDFSAGSSTFNHSWGE